MASISLHNVTKIFDRRTTAVSGVTLDVRDGEFVVIAGPSGCGKTTILRLIAGLEAPTTGEIRIADRVVEGVPPKDRDVAMVFQDGVLYPHMSVYDNLAFPLRMRGLPRDRMRQRVREVVRDPGPRGPAGPQTGGPVGRSTARAWPWAGPWSARRRRSCLMSP